LDLGFYDAIGDYGEKASIHLPHKKPRKSKKNPSPRADSQTKTREQKASFNPNIGGAFDRGNEAVSLLDASH
jgi:hypothetical protein